jgi:hypothetical protein
MTRFGTALNPYHHLAPDTYHAEDWRLQFLLLLESPAHLQLGILAIKLGMLSQGSAKVENVSLFKK